MQAPSQCDTGGFFIMPTMTYEERDLQTGKKERRFTLPALLLTAAIALVIGFLGGQGLEKNNVDVLPGGAPTDGAAGSSASDQ